MEFILHLFGHFVTNYLQSLAKNKDNKQNAEYQIR